MTPADHLDEFLQALEKCKALRDYAATSISDPDVRALTFESALARAFRAYENFVEGAFLSFMTGEAGASGQLANRYVSAPTTEHARKMLQGNQKFLDWADPTLVTMRGAYFLDAEGPMSVAVSQAWNDIDMMRRIRNHVAHNSPESAVQYIKVVHVITLVSPSPPPRPGELLQHRPQRGPFRGREVLSAFFERIESFSKAAAG